MSELSPETEELLKHGRVGAPMSRAHRDELKGAVLAKIATGAILTSSTTAAAWTASTKVIGVAAIAAVLGGGTVGVVEYRAHARAAQNAPTSSIAANATTMILPGASPSAASAITATTAPMNASAGNEAPQSLPQIQMPAPIADPATTIATPPVLAANPPTSQNRSNSPAIASDVGATNSNPSSVGTPTPRKSSLEEETALLRAAHDAIAANDPARALRLLDDHAARFPNSALEPERSAERVFAYCAEQNSASAHAAAASFLSAHPTGPLATRVRSSCGNR